MDPPERDVPPRTNDPHASVDNLPWLQDEKPSTPRALTMPVVPATEGDHGPWWGRFVRRDPAPKPRPPAVAPDGRARPFDGPPDAGTVVASRDDLLRAVREYMGARGSRKSGALAPDAPVPGAPAVAPSAVDESPPSVEEALAVDLEPSESEPTVAISLTDAEGHAARAALLARGAGATGEATTSDGEALPADEGKRREGDIFDVLASRRAQAPPPAPPAEGGEEAPPPDQETHRPAARPRSEDTLTGSSAMERERVLPIRSEGGRSRSRSVPQATVDLSTSSFSLETNPRDTGRFPEAFVSAGLRFLVTRQWGHALEHYRLETRKHPKDVYNLYGLGAALFGLDRLDESAAQFVQAHEADPDFPLAHLVVSTRPDDPIGWYNLSAALVSERTRAAYQCAEIVLTECLGGADDETLRGRAQRVQQDIARMLDQRSRQDKVRQQDGSETWFDTLRNPAVLVGLVVFAVMLFFAWRSLTRPFSMPATSPSPPNASPSPARGLSASPAPPPPGRRR